jgi:hypothetical protein
MTSPLAERMTADMEAAMAAGLPRRRRRPLLWAGLLSVAVAGSAGAAVGFLERGSTADGIPYEITRSDRDGKLCLELRFGDGPAAYGCGAAPTVAKPLGLYVVDRRAGAGVAYGLVDASIERVRVAGVETAAEPRDGLPGRFFVVRGADFSDVTAVGIQADASEVTLAGGGPPNPKPLSRAEAIAASDPAGAAPSVDMGPTVRYRGGTLPAAEAAERGLACHQGERVTRCFDSLAELERATGVFTPGPRR